MNRYIELALEEAKKSLESDDVPVGAVIVENGKVIGKGHNTREKDKSIIGHAEINALQQACKKKNDWYLNECELYVTLEPCPMCLNAISQARIKKICYMTSRNKIECIKEPEKIKCDGEQNAKQLLSDFFKSKRKK